MAAGALLSRGGSAPDSTTGEQQATQTITKDAGMTDGHVICPDCCGSGFWEQATTSGGRFSGCPRCYRSGEVLIANLEAIEIEEAFKLAYGEST